jgi:hypothetical protein
MLFLNAGGTFTEASGDFKGHVKAHRGTAFADFNGDGRMDVAVAALGEPAELWENTGAGANRWVALKLTGTKSNRDGIGAVVRIGKQVNHMTSSVGYGSSSHGPVHFGLGPAAAARIEIRWPSGVLQVLDNVKSNQIVSVTEPAR